MKKSLAILAFIVVAKTLFAQDASWKGAVNFKKDVVNEVAYLCIDNIKFHANIEVTIYGSYSDGPALGRITKRYSFWHTTDGTAVTQYNSEVAVASGAISSRYSIGEVEMYETNKLRIPISKILDADGTTLNVRVSVYSTFYADQIVAALSLTQTTSGTTKGQRNHVTIANSNLGVGITSPTATLDVKGSVIGFPATSGTEQPNAIYRIGSSPTYVVLDFGVNGGSNASSWIQSTKRDQLSMEYPLLLNPNGGNVGIGTTNVPSDYKLAVDGKVIAEEITVKLSEQWPDYVLKPTYSLRSLKEVELFITEKSHLPDVPSATEVEANGIELGEMNAILLKKIEELTLYLIEANKSIDELSRKVEKQDAIINNLVSDSKK